MTDRPIKLPHAEHPITIAPTVGRVVVRAGDVVIADSTAALTLSEARYPPVHYIPRGDVAMARLAPSAHRTYCPYKGEASYFSVPLLGATAANAVWSYEAPYDAVGVIAGYLAFYADRFGIVVEPAARMGRSVPHERTTRREAVTLFFGAGQEKPVHWPEDVRRYLLPDKAYHYRDGYSMAEAAKCWCAANPDLPRSVAAIVGAPDLWRAHVEYPTAVWGGGIAMADVLAFIPGGVIAVEAKVNEPFDDLVADWIEREATNNPRSPDHRRAVVGRYAGALGVPPSALLNIRYQLLQRSLGSARAAKAANVDRAWMIVQDLSYGRGDGHARNRGDFDRFVSLVGPTPTLDGMAVSLAWVDEPEPAQP